jgi:uncharacterized protein (TIGR03067 family)
LAERARFRNITASIAPNTYTERFVAMKTLPVGLCLLTTALLASPSRAQDAASEKQAAAQRAPAKETKTDQDQDKKDKEAVPEKIVPEKEAIKQLVGDYRIVSGENSGEEVLPERLVDVTVRFTEKTVTTYDGERNARFTAAYRLDTQQRPWRIKMTSTPKPSKAAAAPTANAASTTSDGLIELADGRVKVIYALPGGLAPESFQTGERQQLFVLERLPDPTEKTKDAAASEKEGK